MTGQNRAATSLVAPTPALQVVAAVDILVLQRILT